MSKQERRKKQTRDGHRRIRLNRGALVLLIGYLSIFQFTANVFGWEAGSRGIDISEHNSNVDFVRLKADGNVNFAILRLGFGTENIGTNANRGVYNDDIYMDLKLEQYQKAATAAGFPIMGYYHYAYGQNAEQGEGEAEHAIKLLQRIGAAKDSYVIYDVEQYHPDTAEGKKGINDAAQTFLEKVEAAGYRPMLYSGYSYYYEILDEERLRRFDKWIAHYMDTAQGETVNDHEALLSRGYNAMTYRKILEIPGVKLWQYSESGVFAGSGGRVDVNVVVGNMHQLLPPQPQPGAEGDMTREQALGAISQAMKDMRYRTDGSSIIANVAPQDDLKHDIERALPGATVTVTQADQNRLATGDSVNILYGGQTSDWSVAVLGDADGNAGCNIIDVGMMIRHITKKQELTSLQIQAADINDDGVINILDVGAAVRHIRKLRKFYE
ncbi:MAG: GH25 family lysozyme [Lachnospiraceae bacterium]|nr:GH25 family lysozyme [Lachnospiraceae bacterium]MDY5742135.1 GH25 family lysozyme [Lachnospiraceae bacterium]